MKRINLDNEIETAEFIRKVVFIIALIVAVGVVFFNSDC